MKTPFIWLIIAFCVNVIATAAPAPAPGYGALAFKPAAPDSYQLPIVGTAVDGEVLTDDGGSRRLHSLMGDKIVLLSFIYATCSDANGCPLATKVLHDIARQLPKQPVLADKLRLLTLSFNPQHDTPEAMRRYGRGFNSSGFDWRFLTTASEQSLQPILDGYRQSVQKVYDADGRFTGTYSHLLRVYLIDTDKHIRNVYSVDFLHADTVLNDVQSLLIRHDQALVPQTGAVVRLGPGDDKRQYQQSDYQTHSQALSQRQGRAIDLLGMARRPPLGLPKLPVPADNPLTAGKVRLGRKLFYDRRLSLNDTFSCAMCHIPEQGFTSNEMATAVGVEGRSVRRNSPTLYNVGYQQRLFHDGRETTLEQQAWGPLLAHNEMANPSIGYVVEKLRGLADYRGLFETAFGKPADMATIGMALASYQRTLNAADSPFDRWLYGKQADAMSAAAQRGYRLFVGKAGCSACHQIERRTALLTDHRWHNTGTGYRQSMTKTPPQQQVQVAPGLTVTVDSAQLQSVAERKPNDLGRYEISQRPEDRWRYKTPSLRNVALTAPYMHDGSLSSLEDVVRFYNQGGVANDNLSPLIKPLALADAEIAELVAFLQALTGSTVEQLIADAFAAPIGDSGRRP